MALAQLAVFGSLAPGCTTTSRNLEAALWVPDGATIGEDGLEPSRLAKGRSTYPDGSGALVFTVPSDCHTVARQLADHFAGAGWVAREWQLRNPRVATSFAHGCERSSGGVARSAVDPDELHFAWVGEWENATGDFLMYSIGGTGRALRGYAQYIPVKLRPYRP